MEAISKPLLKWFDVFGRKNLPWQSTPKNPYHVWISEVMLQQTQVLTVIGYFNNFIQNFPTLATLAAAKEDTVLRQWAGLGYYARARNLHASAKIIMAQYQGEFPREFAQIINLPGIGKSSAAAILSISFNQNHTILDGNVRRVLSRYHEVSGHYGQAKTLKRLWHLAEKHTPNQRIADYTQAIMDFGATLCTRQNPSCQHCPIAQGCQTKKHKTQAIFPNPKPKKPKPTKKIAMLIFINEKNRVYLQKRPSKGIWGGLWSFVECENNKNSISQAITNFDKNAQKQKTLPAFKHSFTHYHLLIHPVLIDCKNSNKTFYPASQHSLGLPAPVNKIISQLNKFAL